MKPPSVPPYRSSFRKSDSWREIYFFDPHNQPLLLLSINVKQLVTKQTLMKNKTVVFEIFVEVKVGSPSQFETFLISGNEKKLTLQAKNYDPKTEVKDQSFNFRKFYSDGAGPQNLWELCPEVGANQEVWTELDQSSNTALTTLFAFYTEAIDRSGVTNLN